MGSFDSSRSSVLSCDSWLHSAVTQNTFLADFVLQMFDKMKIQHLQIPKVSRPRNSHYSTTFLNV